MQRKVEFDAKPSSRIRFLVGDERGWVQFLMTTGWFPECQWPQILRMENEWQERHRYNRPIIAQPKAYDLGYHSPTPRYEGQTSIDGCCPYLGGRECYYDGSGLHAEPILRRFLEEGDCRMGRARGVPCRGVWESGGVLTR